MRPSSVSALSYREYNSSLRLSGIKGGGMGIDENSYISVAESLLNDGYDIRIGIRGTSMLPLLSTGDMITIHCEKDYQKGALTVIKRDGHMACSRLVNIFEQDGITYYQTRGDAVFGFGEVVTSDLILGKVIKIERQKVSLPRRILIFSYPALRFGNLNAYVISSLIKIRAIIFFTKGRIFEGESFKKNF